MRIGVQVHVPAIKPVLQRGQNSVRVPELREQVGDRLRLRGEDVQAGGVVVYHVGLEIRGVGAVGESTGDQVPVRVRGGAEEVGEGDGGGGLVQPPAVVRGPQDVSLIGSRRRGLRRRLRCVRAGMLAQGLVHRGVLVRPAQVQQVAVVVLLHCSVGAGRVRAHGPGPGAVAGRGDVRGEQHVIQDRSRLVVVAGAIAAQGLTLPQAALVEVHVREAHTLEVHREALMRAEPCENRILALALVGAP
mmetsp:Transcript_24580/g.56098  ORF Transcript_24580/g.56098 Transcript_24580/m.56098 type:complete len:246 (+) Transcript_24580:95-832(+)